ncbi:hypothetical protein I7I51_03406 [Histoplasma capsulatum]|uniref:Uncharacterized protein n=1 Tax=Ajellomyces capsulatus TaxID=5037 RepID=A0A8A1M9D9_AJECA|nr:predicted protein [Histoplasma mississippiense (nom. inval.)]EDN07326.1 predicted protein [Histoplasma mississippiense (nom. inval.)]QSS61234.1 hypothetical protein I7I51_03406 [Histoplasma capsulatum]
MARIILGHLPPTCKRACLGPCYPVEFSVKDLNMSGPRFNIALAIFFVPYVLCVDLIQVDTHALSTSWLEPHGIRYLELLIPAQCGRQVFEESQQIRLELGDGCGNHDQASFLRCPIAWQSFFSPNLYLESHVWPHITKVETAKAVPKLKD